MKRLHFLVTLPEVEGVTRRDMATYVREAVQCWAGQYRPPGGHGPDDLGDPMFTEIYQNQHRVTVKPA